MVCETLLKKTIMKGQKQSKTDLLEKRQQALIKVVQQLLDENAYLKEIGRASCRERV